MMFLLDTNICIYLMKNQPETAAKRFSECILGVIVISGITLTELEYGVEVSRNRSENAQALTDLPDDPIVAPFDGLYKPMGQFEPRKGKVNPDGLDKLISGHARALDLALVTNNEKKFPPLSRVTG